MPGHLSSETLDLLALAALGPRQALAARKHLEACRRCMIRWDQLNADIFHFQQLVLMPSLRRLLRRKY